jgi:anti-sigma-K factor RskA
MAESNRSHPDLLTLDASRAGEEVHAADAGHVAACPSCQAQLADLVGLADGVKALHGSTLPVTSDVDARILWLARGHAARIGRRKPRWSRLVGAPATWAAAAAAVLALASALFLARREQPTGERLTRVAAAPPAAKPAALADLDGDGRVTVLDAFALARALETHAAASAVDVNHDTQVDEDDVDAVLAMAVSVRGT